METQLPTPPQQEFTQMNHTAMIEYLATEISTLSTNIMTFRSRVTFSISAGPFFLLGSIILLTSSKGLTLGFNPAWGWQWKTPVITLLILATLWIFAGYIFLGYLSGRIEEGAVNRCNEWRKCIIKLQAGTKLDTSELESMILDRPTWRGTYIYMSAFVVMFLTFLAIMFSVITLVRNVGGTPG